MADSVVLSVVVVFGVLAIAGLCWVWMRSSRASQARMEEHNRRIISLLERQNDLLTRLSEKADRGEGLI